MTVNRGPRRSQTHTARSSPSLSWPRWRESLLCRGCMGDAYVTLVPLIPLLHAALLASWPWKEAQASAVNPASPCRHYPSAPAVPDQCPRLLKTKTRLNLESLLAITEAPGTAGGGHWEQGGRGRSRREGKKSRVISLSSYSREACFMASTYLIN